jgi:hypothetical protein
MMNSKPEAMQEEDDEIPANIDFSKGVRGKFYHPNATFNLPVYLDMDVQHFLAELAAKKGVDMSDLANDILKKDIALIDALR